MFHRDVRHFTAVRKEAERRAAFVLTEAITLLLNTRIVFGNSSTQGNILAKIFHSSLIEIHWQKTAKYPSVINHIHTTKKRAREDKRLQMCSATRHETRFYSPLIKRQVTSSMFLF